MAAFLESPVFPDDLGFWAQGGVSFNTVVSTSASGREQRNILWQYGRGKWDLRNLPRTNAMTNAYNIQTLRTFFRTMKGQAYGFRFRDWTDYQDESNGILGAPVTNLTQAIAPTGLGLGIPTYQMFKVYQLNTLVDYRVVQKPRTSTVSILKNGSTWSGTLDYTTGLFTVIASATQTITSNTPGATTVLGLAGTLTGAVVGSALYVTGVSGTLGTFLNNQAWIVSAISGSNYTINAATTGLTGSGGAAALYPGQPTDTITWTGQFDTPCRFGNDLFDAIFGNDGLCQVNLQIVEIRL